MTGEVNLILEPGKIALSEFEKSLIVIARQYIL